jgi:hypothetical protein
VEEEEEEEVSLQSRPSLKEDHRMRMFKDKALGKISGIKWVKARGEFGGREGHCTST